MPLVGTIAPGLLIAGLALVLAEIPQPQAYSQDFEKNSMTPRVELTILNKRYCEAGGEVAMLHLDLAARFVNTSQHTLIVPRGAIVSQLAMADSLSELEHTKSWFIDNFTAVPRYRTTKRPGRDFAILRPGENVEIRVPIAIPYVFTATPNIRGPGSYLLRVWIDSSLDSDPHARIAAKLAECWRQWGDLWAGLVPSLPTAIVIDHDAKLERCDSPR